MREPPPQTSTSSGTSFGTLAEHLDAMPAERTAEVRRELSRARAALETAGAPEIATVLMNSLDCPTAMALPVAKKAHDKSAAFGADAASATAAYHAALERVLQG